MARGEISGRKPRGPKADAGTKSTPIRGPPTPPACYSIASFCTAHHLSQAMYFKMRAEGWGPAEMRVGKRVLVSFEAAGRWRAEREAAGA